MKENRQRRGEEGREKDGGKENLGGKRRMERRIGT